MVYSSYTVVPFLDVYIGVTKEGKALTLHPNPKVGYIQKK